MQRWSASLIFPITACALGVLAAFAFVAIGAPVWPAFAIGLTMTVGALALRNWWVGEEERPLLAEELLGLHEALDVLRNDAQELREMMSEAAEVAEYRISEDADEPSGRLQEAQRRNAALEDLVVKLEARIAALETQARTTAKEPTPYIDRFEDRLERHEIRTRKLVTALSMAIDAASRHDQRLRSLEKSEPRTEGPSAPAATASPTSAQEPEQTAPKSASPEPAITVPTPKIAVSPAEAPAAPSPQVAAPVGASSAVAGPKLRAPIAPKRPVSASRAPSPEGAASASPLNAPPVVATPVATRPVATEPAPPEPAPAAPGVAPALPPRMAEPAVEEIDTDEAPAQELRVLPILRADTRDLRLFEVTPDGVSEEDVEAGVLLEEALALAAGCYRRGSAVGALFRIGLGALRSDATLAPLLSHLRADPGIAQLLVPAISETEMRDLSDQDFALMRRLSDAGVRFALRDVDGAELNVKRAAEAGVRTILLGIDGVVEREAAAPGGLENLAQSLAKHGVTLVLTGVDLAELADWVADVPGVLAQGEAVGAARQIRFA